MRGKADDISNYYLKLRITPAYAGKSVLIACVCSLWEDHPRLCGEKPTPEFPLVTSIGITPAYAGKSFNVRVPFFNFWDHPRLCGEKVPRLTYLANNQGSPPPMRGKACFTNSFSKAARITPAYAGKRTWCSSGIHRNEDHPRLCGEKLKASHASIRLSGSPPPMRGKVAAVQKRVNQLRITPAYAGKSFLSTSRAFCNQDHPRLCGEKFPEFHCGCMNQGSPPPMRGKVQLSVDKEGMKRITPAYAGKSGRDQQIARYK